MNFFKKSIVFNNAESYFQYGKLLYKGKLSSTKSYKKISSYFEKSISLGCSNAMYKYGKILMYDSRFPLNPKKGFEYIRKAAENEHPIAQYIYSIMLKLTDKKCSFEYMRKSAYNGYVPAMNTYACDLKEGKNKDENSKKEYILFFKKASEEGSINAIHNYQLDYLK